MVDQRFLSLTVAYSAMYQRFHQYPSVQRVLAGSSIVGAISSIADNVEAWVEFLS